MSEIENRLRGLWDRLRGKKKHLPHFLNETHLAGIRGIDDLRVVFDYPVSVIAGGNGSGKSTVLFAAACAYTVPGAGIKDFVPSTLFPDYRPRIGRRRDGKQEVDIAFDYSTPDGRLAMRWHRAAGWNRSFLGRKHARQPERQVYLRTLSNLSHPSEVRGVLSLSRLKTAPQETALTASQIAFAQQMLPFRYDAVVDLTGRGKKTLLFAAREGGAAYSELHMAAGERAILRLAQEIAQLDGALVLIDEVEAGLHPWVQQLLMLQMQQLALRRDLQIIVTSHSPVVLDTVPPEGRIFLDRDDTGRVSVQEPWRDVVQDALYGRSRDVLNLLCEDEAAEAVVQGVMDVLTRTERLKGHNVRIGRDTGADEFPAHAAAFRKFGQIRNFVFILDGDRSDLDRTRIRQQAGEDVPVLLLPGGDAPEVWIWERLGQRVHDMADAINVSRDELAGQMRQLNAIYDTASDSPANIAKSKLRALADALHTRAAAIGRVVAGRETERQDSDIQPLAEGLKDALLRWRAP